MTLVWDPAFDIAGRLVGHRIGQGPRGDLDRVKRQHGHAVEALLAQDLDLVAGGLDFEPRKLRLLRLDLLQDDDVGLGILQPRQEVSRPLADGIDVPGRDLHRRRITR